MKAKKLFSTAVVALALTVGLTVGLVVGAGAANAQQQRVTATLDQGIGFKYNGESVVPTNSNDGSRAYAIMYNGRTYVPVRAIGELVGIGVDWDQATRTVLLGDPADGVDLIDTIKAYDFTRVYAIYAEQIQTADKQNLDISGVNCSHWVYLNMTQYAAKGSLCAASFNVGGKYKTVTFQCYSDQDITLRVLGDNDSVLKQVSIKGGQLAQTITVDLLSSSQLTFQAEKMINSAVTRDQATNAYIFDAKLK